MSQEQVGTGWLRPAETPFYRRAEDFVAWCMREQNWKLTDFLSPREFQILTSVAHREGCVLASYGGATNCERVRAYVMPGDWGPTPEDFSITLLEVHASEGNLSHGAVLGSILGTGIDRRKIGDIEVIAKQVIAKEVTGKEVAEKAVIAVCQDIVPFLQQNWVSVGRFGVSLQAKSDATFHGPEYVPQQVSVASPRLDALLGACCHWSRTKAKEAIQKGDVQLNFAEVTHPDESVTEGDILSVRHFGRIRIFEALGESRKGRLRLEVGIVKSK